MHHLFYFLTLFIIIGRYEHDSGLNVSTLDRYGPTLIVSGIELDEIVEVAHFSV